LENEEICLDLKTREIYEPVLDRRKIIPQEEVNERMEIRKEEENKKKEELLNEEEESRNKNNMLKESKREGFNISEQKEIIRLVGIVDGIERQFVENIRKFGVYKEFDVGEKNPSSSLPIVLTILLHHRPHLHSSIYAMKGLFSVYNV
jgi:hypothetical protein